MGFKPFWKKDKELKEREAQADKHYEQTVAGFLGENKQEFSLVSSINRGFGPKPYSPVNTRPMQQASGPADARDNQPADRAPSVSSGSVVKLPRPF